jgi:hypothetical protein
MEAKGGAADPSTTRPSAVRPDAADAFINGHRTMGQRSLTGEQPNVSSYVNDDSADVAALPPGYVLPATLFPTLAVLAAKYIVPNFTRTSLASEIGSACTPGLSFARPYIGHEDFDKFMCGLVTFFDFSLQPESEALTTDLVGALLPIILFTFVESARFGHYVLFSSLVTFVVSIGYQRGWAILPLYWILFLLAGGAILPL